MVSEDEFDRFVALVEARLQQALVATFGLRDGREAAVDALSWAWEHWDQAARLDHPVRYLYRVGVSARRRFASRPVPVDDHPPQDAPELSVELYSALGELPHQQRCAVLLVVAYQWRQQEVADLLGVSPSTVHAHLSRGRERLRELLEVHDVC